MSTDLYVQMEFIDRCYIRLFFLSSETDLKVFSIPDDVLHCLLLLWIALQISLNGETSLITALSAMAANREKNGVRDVLLSKGFIYYCQ